MAGRLSTASLVLRTLVARRADPAACDLRRLVVAEGLAAQEIGCEADALNARPRDAMGIPGTDRRPNWNSTSWRLAIMKVHLLHGWHSVPGSVKSSLLAEGWSAGGFSRDAPLHDHCSLPSALAGCYNLTASARLHVDGCSVQGYLLMSRITVATALFSVFAISASAQESKPADPAPLQLTAQHDHKLMRESHGHAT
jgi:hypothetical protein